MGIIHYGIDGEPGLWKIAGDYLDKDENIIMIFQNIGSGKFLEIEICPFDWITKHTTFKKWDL